MARTIGRFFALGALAMLLYLCFVGCGPKPPCEGASIVSVQTAQDECSAAGEELEGARQQRASLEGEVTEAKAELSKLKGTPVELSGYLEDLKKGSGR